MLPLYLSLAALPAFASAYSWSFTNTPQQCESLNIALSGSGTPPYSVLIIPFGPSPLANNTEVRRIFEVSFSGSSTSFQLPYPTNSQFVAVVSDASGFGTGGTSIAATVLSSDAPVCYNMTEVSPEWAFSIVPANQVVECSPTRIWWTPSAVEGTPSFQGVIPGGQSFAIPESNFTTVPEEGYGFEWTPSVRIGTTVILVGGDNRGPGTGGSGLYIVSQGSTQSCLNANSPSSTPGSPAGGTYPTSTSGADVGGGGSGGSGSGGSSHTDVGAIVGGVVGGVGGFALILIALFLLFRRRRRVQKEDKERPVDLLHDSEQDHDDGRLPQYYEPEPFMLPEPTVLSSTDEDGGRPRSDGRSAFLAASADGRPESTRAGGSSRARKSPAPSLRPVNIVQHEDAGRPEEQGQEGQEPETIELPPAYTHLRKSSSPKTENASPRTEEALPRAEAQA